MQWFRLYDDLIFNAKAQALQPKLFKHWISILCLASRNTPRGTLPSMERVSFALHTTITRASLIVQSLIDLRFIEKDNTIHDWTQCQYESDDSAARKRKQRSQSVKQESPVTVTPPDTDSDTEQIQKGKKPSVSLLPSGNGAPKYSPEFERFWGQSSKRGSKLEAGRAWVALRPSPELQAQIQDGMEEWQQSEQWQDESKQPHVGRWLKRRGWEEVVPRRLIVEASNGNGNRHKHSERCREYGFCPEAK